MEEEKPTIKEDSDEMEEAPPLNIFSELKYEEYVLTGTNNHLFYLRIFLLDNSTLLFYVKTKNNNLNEKLYKTEITLQEFYKLNNYFRQYSTCEQLYSILFSKLKKSNIYIYELTDKIKIDFSVGIKGKEELISFMLNPEKSSIEKIMWNLCDKIKVIEEKNQIEEEKKIHEFNKFKNSSEDISKNKDTKKDNKKKNKNKLYFSFFKTIIKKNKLSFFIIISSIFTELLIVKRINQKEKDIIYLKNEINHLKSNICNNINVNKVSSKTKKTNKIYNGIIKPDELDFIENEIKKSINKNIKNYKLLFRASRDGFEAKDFHKKCDGVSNTLILIKTKSGKRFGGFTEAEWDTYSEYKNGKKGFIFSMYNKEIYYNKYGQYNIYCNETIGPSFRGGPHDFTIWDLCNTSNKSFEYIQNLNNNNYVLEGDKHFFVKDYEVYNVEFE